MVPRADARRFLLLVVLLATGCSAHAPPSDVPVRPLSARDIAKSDVDSVAELANLEVRTALRELSLKLYRRNPAYLARHRSGESPEALVGRLHDRRRPAPLASLGRCQPTDCVLRSLSGGYDGDRVYAFAYGLLTMVDAAYEGRREFFLLDDLDPQKLYNSARNIEIAAWKLRSAVGAGGVPLLLSNSRDGEAENLSYERLFGKMIAMQDLLARIVAEKTNRTVKFVVLQVMTAMFLPI